MKKDNVIKALGGFVAIESVSTDPDRFSEILKAARYLSDKLTSMGFDIKTVGKKDHPPLIIAQKTVSPSAKTIGIYGHYDVQPEDPVSEWKTPPFTLTIREGKFFGRGVADSKGHVIQNIVAIEKLINENKLKNNIIFIFEGEEESNSKHFEEDVLEAKKTLSRADVFYIVDLGMRKRDIPLIGYALRGLVYFELKVQIGTYDLHSGSYGNRVLNPIHVLADLLSKMKDLKTGKINISHFYDDVRRPSEKELTLLSKAEQDEAEAMTRAGVYRFVSVDKKFPYLSSKIHPSLDASGILSGFTDEGSKTIIPYHASMKFSCRLVENQNPDKIEKLVRDYIAKFIPEGVKYELKTLSKSAPFYTSLENKYVSKTAEALKSVFGHEVQFSRSGGTIAAAEILQRVFNKPCIGLGFALSDSRIHAPNENFDEYTFWKGIEALQAVYGSDF